MRERPKCENFCRNAIQLALTLVWLATLGCVNPRRLEEHAVRPQPSQLASYTVVTHSLGVDPELESVIAPFRTEVEARVSEVIGHAAVEILPGSPEGPLGNFVTDAMLFEARRLASRPVHFAVSNNGGIRKPIAAGPITVGDVFELIPFENELVLVTLTGTQIETLAQQLAQSNGEPVSHFAFVITSQRTAKEIRVDNQSVQPEAEYTLATSDFLVNGGGRIPVLWEGIKVERTGITVRDAVIQFIRRSKQPLNPQRDGRIILEP